MVEIQVSLAEFQTLVLAQAFAHANMDEKHADYFAVESGARSCVCYLFEDKSFCEWWLEPGRMVLNVVDHTGRKIASFVANKES